MNKIKLLLVEDDPNLGDLLKEFLEMKNYDVTLARDGEAGWNTFQKDKYVLCIFDIMMPKMDGFSLAKLVRGVNKTIPILFLTAKSLKEDKLEGFKLGADDYITKPFSMEELEMRIEAVLRRCQITFEVEQDENYVIGNYKFDFDTQLLEIGGESKKLTTKEAQLLRLLSININKVLEREIALKSIWGDDDYFTARSMDVFITKLRKHLKQDETIQIVNIHGKGYKLLVK